MLDASVVFPCPLAVTLRRMHDLLFNKKCTNSCPVWPLKRKWHVVYLFFCISLFLCRARSRSLLSAAVSMTWTPWSALCHPPHRRLRHPSPRALCRLYRPQQALPLRDSSPTQTNSARSSMNWWRRRRLTSKSVQFLPQKSVSDSSVSVSIWWTCHNYCKRHAEHWHSFHVVWVMFILGFFWFLSV